MKKSLVLVGLTIPFMLLIASGCTSTVAEINNDDDSFVGQWQLVEQNISNTGSSSWSPVADGITFRLNEDGAFFGAIPPINCDAGTFETINDELVINYNCTDYTNSIIFAISVIGDDIILSATNAGCIEGCEYKYRKTE